MENGVATLSGTVSTDAQRERAEALATAAGATRVENRLDRGRRMPTRKAPTGKLERKSREGADKTKDGAEKAWDKTKEGANKAGAEVTDGWITTDLKTRFTSDETLRDERHPRRHGSSRGDAHRFGAESRSQRESRCHRAEDQRRDARRRQAEHPAVVRP